MAKGDSRKANDRISSSKSEQEGIVREKLTTDIPEEVIKPIKHLAVDIELSLREITEAAFEQCIKSYTKHTKSGIFEALPRDKEFEVMPAGGEKITAMIDKDLFKKIKHFAIDWDTDIRQITIFAFTKYLAANGIKIREQAT